MNRNQNTEKFHRRLAGALLLAACVLVTGQGLADNGNRLMARQVMPGEGEVRWLDVGGKPCLSVLKQQTTETPKGGVIILPDRGQGPEWPVLVRPLRLELPEHGWHTLTVAVPVTGMGQAARKTENRLQRADALINAALATFEGEKLPAIYLVGRGWGAYTAAAYLARNPDAKINGLVLVEVPMVQELGPELETSSLMASIKVPVLDLFADRGRRGNWQAQWRRQAMTSAGREQYRQTELDPTAFLPIDQGELVKSIRGWIHAQPVPAVEVAPRR